MLCVRRYPLFLACLVSGGCGEGGSGLFGKDVAEETGTSPGEDANLTTPEELFYLHDKAWKLAVFEGALWATTQHGGELWTWVEGQERASEALTNLSSVEAVEPWGGELWVSMSDTGVEGSVGPLDAEGAVVVRATGTASGALMRRPLEMVVQGGDLFIADSAAGAIWRLSPGADVVVALNPPVDPLTLESWQGELVIGADEGVWVDRNGAWESLDDRAAYGLAALGDRLFATNAVEGLFEVGGADLMGPGPARPGSIVAWGDDLYLADQVGGSVWRLSLEP